jgi:HlyD family secretion protein
VIRSRPRTTAILAVLLVGLVTAAVVWRQSGVDPSMTAVVRRGTLSATLTASGVLKPVQSVTYRSPLGGREAEVTFLVAEGTRVGEGDLIARLDATDLQQELERTIQELRQAQVDAQVAEIDVQQGQAAIDSLTQGEGALSVEEAKTRLQLAERTAARLKEELAGLKPLMEKGFITREELRRTEDELERSEQELTLARRRADVLTKQTHPQERQRAGLQLAQKQAQVANVKARQREIEARASRLAEQIENSSLYARRGGLVVYEDYLAASPRRKIRTGDRVTGSQGLVTIPDVDRMIVESSVTEASLHRLKPGQTAIVRLEAFPDMRLQGTVGHIGTMATRTPDRPIEDKRFDVVVELAQSAPELRPEMTARVDILISEKQDVLLVPVNAVFEQQGQLVCFVVRPFGLEARPVQIGEANDTEAEVLAGLAEGDVVSLVDSARAPAAPATGAGSQTPSKPVSGPRK